MRWTPPLPRFDFYKEKPLVKLIALALVMSPAILYAVSWVIRAFK